MLINLSKKESDFRVVTGPLLIWQMAVVIRKNLLEKSAISMATLQPLPMYLMH
jgi:hypothetical protein